MDKQLDRYPKTRKLDGSVSAFRKNSQVTVYIIIGAIILIISSYLIATGKISLLQKQDLLIQQTVDPAVAPIHLVVTECLQEVAMSGLLKIGSFGGYLDPRFKVDDSDPTEAEALSFLPGSDIKIPYYWYLSSKNDCKGSCVYKMRIPPLKRPAKGSIESQLDRYVNANIKSCITFEQLAKQGLVVKEVARPDATTTVSKDSVIVALNYSLSAKRFDQDYRLDNFVVQVPVKLDQVYELASALTELEGNFSYLERHSIQLLGLAAGTIPPVSDLKFSLGQGTQWSKSAVQKTIIGLLTAYTPLLQVFGTKNYKKVIPPSEVVDKKRFDALYNRNMIVIPSLEKGYPDLEADFIYLDFWKPYFDLNCAGDVCRPDVLTNTLLPIPLGIQKYEFQYDISHPVVVMIKDPDAFGGKGFTYQFALESNVRNNKPLPTVFNPNQMVGVPDSMFCDSEQLNSPQVTLNIRDAVTNYIIDDASIFFTCGYGPDMEGCSVASSINSTFNLPVCIGGTLRIEKQGYLSKQIQIDTDVINPSQNVNLEPLAELDLNLKRFRLLKESGDWSISETAVSLAPDEEAFVTLTPATGDPVFAYINGDSVFEDYTSSSINLAPGTYTVDITLTRHPSLPIVIQPKKQCFDDRCIMIPDKAIVFDENENPFQSGGGSYNITVKRDDLKKDSITLYAIDLALDIVDEDDRELDDLDQVSKINDYCLAYASKLKPVFD